jgi:SAM-dependent methyltransferase
VANSVRQCQICGGPLRLYLDMPIDAKKDEPTSFSSLVRCQDCGTAMISPQPTPDDVPAFYQLSRYYTHGESHMRHVEPRIWDKILTKLAWWCDHPSPFSVEEMVKRLAPGASICDLGCGHGLLLKRFKDLGFDVIGVDPDPSSREFAAKSGIIVLEGTAERAPAELANRQFDLVLMTHSLEHCIAPMAAIANAFRMTKEGGYFYCEVPNCGCLHFQAFTVCSEMFDSPRHLWFFTAQSLLRAMDKGGFVFDSWRFDGFTRHHSPGWRAWETTIFDRLTERSVNAGRRHTFLRSASLLARSAVASPARKYDCVGVLAIRR